MTRSSRRVTFVLMGLLLAARVNAQVNHGEYDTRPGATVPTPIQSAPIVGDLPPNARCVQTYSIPGASRPGWTLVELGDKRGFAGSAFLERDSAQCSADAGC